jgi:hypothetical protein
MINILIIFSHIRESNNLAIKYGVYVDKEADAIGVLVEDDAAAKKVPKSIEDVPVTVTITGRIKAYYSRTGMDTPIFGGISLGSQAIYCSSGTLGDVTHNSQPYILSNAHVLALDYNANFVPIGSNPTWQAGGADTNCGSSAYNVVGNLSNYIPITFMDTSANNSADAAIANVNPGITYSQGKELNNRNNGFYTVSGLTTVNSGDSVRKSGRTTGVTTGRVLTNSATVQVWYTNTQWAYFKDQIVVYGSRFSAPGDSGSVVDKNGQWAGLLFAGGGSYTIISKASYIAAQPTGIGSSNTGGLGVII